MTNPLYTIDKLPTTSQAAIREFDDRYLAALGASDPSGWAYAMGELIPTTSPLVTYPLTQLGNKYFRTTGEDRARARIEKDFSIRTEEFDIGAEAALFDLFTKVFAWRRWQEEPGRFVTAEEQHVHDNVAVNLIEANATNGVYTLFSATQPINLGDASVGTFSNLQTTPKDVVSVANLEAEIVAMMTQVKDENGKKMGVRPDSVLVPLEKAEPLQNLLNKQMIPSAAGTASEDNPYYKGLKVIPVREFTDVNDWFLVDSKMVKQLPPWAIMRMTVPGSLALRKFDESSDFFKHSGKLKVSSHIWYGFSVGFPHAIRKVVGA